MIRQPRLGNRVVTLVYRHGLTMGRTKLYERDDLLNRAIKVFHRQGYNGTSTTELAEALGVNRKSMYAEFGSKQGLFEAALEHYSEHHLSGALQALEAPDASLTGIARAFNGYATAGEGPMRGLGCLLGNTAVERGALAPEIGRHVDAYVARVQRAFQHALENAQRTRELGEEADVDALASFLTMSLIGIAALARAEAPAHQIRAASDVVVRVLDPNK